MNSFKTPSPAVQLLAGSTLLALLIAVIGLLAAALALVDVQPALREWGYRETSYRVILSQTFRPAEALTPEEVTLRIADYVHR